MPVSAVSVGASTRSGRGRRSRGQVPGCSRPASPSSRAPSTPPLARLPIRCRKSLGWLPIGSGAGLGKSATRLRGSRNGIVTRPGPSPDARRTAASPRGVQHRSATHGDQQVGLDPLQQRDTTADRRLVGLRCHLAEHLHVRVRNLLRNRSTTPLLGHGVGDHHDGFAVEVAQVVQRAFVEVGVRRHPAPLRRGTPVARALMFSSWR